MRRRSRGTEHSAATAHGSAPPLDGPTRDAGSPFEERRVGEELHEPEHGHHECDDAEPTEDRNEIVPIRDPVCCDKKHTAPPRGDTEEPCGRRSDLIRRLPSQHRGGITHENDDAQKDEERTYRSRREPPLPRGRGEVSEQPEHEEEKTPPDRCGLAE